MKQSRIDILNTLRATFPKNPQCFDGDVCNYFGNPGCAVGCLLDPEDAKILDDIRFGTLDEVFTRDGKTWCEEYLPQYGNVVSKEVVELEKEKAEAITMLRTKYPHLMENIDLLIDAQDIHDRRLPSDFASNGQVSREQDEVDWRNRWERFFRSQEEAEEAEEAVCSE